MPRSALIAPRTDPTPIFEAFRGSYATELLTAAVAHFRLFARLAEEPLPPDALRRELELAERPAAVLFTALKAMGLIAENAQGEFQLTPLAAEHLSPRADFDVSDYLGLAADSPGVLEMVRRLRTNRPAGAEQDEGAAFIYREGEASAMEQAASARRLTLAGRARNVAPHLAEQAQLAVDSLVLDVGGGTGIYRP